MKRKPLFVLCFAFLLLGAAVGNIRWTQLRSGDRHGTQAQGQSSDGTGASGNCAKFNADGSVTDSGLVCAAAVGGSGLTLLEEHTAASSSTLNFTSCITSTYDDYIIQLTQVTVGTSTANLLIRMSTDGGSTYDSGTNYDTAVFAFVSAGSGTNGGTGQTSLLFAPSLATTANMSVAGTFHLAAPGGSIYKQTYWQIFARDTNNAHAEGFIGAGTYLNTTAVNAFQFLTSTGTFSGTIRCYGLSK